MAKKANSNKTKTATALRLDADLLKRIDEVASLQNSSRTTVIEQCLDAGLPQLKKFFEDFQKSQKTPSV